MVPGSVFDWVLATVLATVSVVLLLGKGDMILYAMNGSNQKKAKKKTEEEKKKFSRAMGIFVAVLAADEVLIAFFSETPWMMVICLLIAVIDLVLIGRYIKKHK